MHQQEQQCQEKPSRKERGSSAPPPPSPVFCPFSFPPQPVNLFNIPGFTNISSFAPGEYDCKCEKQYVFFFFLISIPSFDINLMELWLILQIEVLGVTVLK